jgi:hypothetical protein
LDTQRLTRVVRSPGARVVVAIIGFLAIVLLVERSGTREVWDALSRAAGLFPLVIALEAGMVACDMVGLRLLYGPDRRRLTVPALIRAGLVGYPVMCLVPMGRAIAEATRAALLSRHTSVARAGAAAARLQGLLLLANAFISVPCAIALYLKTGPTLMTAAIAFNAVATTALGAGVIYAVVRSRLGTWLASKTAHARHVGPAFDATLRAEPSFPLGAMAWTAGARVVQLLQYTVLVVAVGGTFGIGQGLVAEGVHLVGAMVGDFVPGQLGATEANFTFATAALGLSAGDALAIALLAHLAQMFWVAVGLLVPLVWAPEAAEPSPAGAAPGVVD